MRRRVARRIEELFNRRVIQNNLRAIYVEILVVELLGAPWKLVSHSWSSWDIEAPDGTRVEIKQSAALQSWDSSPQERSRPTFDIKPRSGYWLDEKQWVEKAGRHADVFIFCWHPVDGDDCDQRDPTQWQFYVAPSAILPKQNSISLGPLADLVSPCSSCDLRKELDVVARALGPDRANWRSARSRDTR